MHERIRLSFTVVVLFILLLASGSGPVATAKPPARTYTIIDLGTRGGPDRGAVGIHARGQVVRHRRPAGSFAITAFLWEAGTCMQDLGTLGGSSSFAYGINARGQVVGFSYTAAGAIHGFLWEAG